MYIGSFKSSLNRELVKYDDVCSINKTSKGSFKSEDTGEFLNLQHKYSKSQS